MPHLRPIKEIVDEVIEKQKRINRVNGFNLGSDATQIHINELHIALKQRDEEWEKMIDSIRKRHVITCAYSLIGDDCDCGIYGHNEALNDLIKISKE